MMAGDIATDEAAASRVADVLVCYREDLLRDVAGKLVRPRSRHSEEILREKIVEALADPVGLDRALKPMSPASRQLLRLVDLSRSMRWPVQALADLLPVLGFDGGLAPVIDLLEAGLLFPEVAGANSLESIRGWIEQAGQRPLFVFTAPGVAERCRSEPLTLDFPAGSKAKLAAVESDGLEWLLRASALWQLLRGGPLRRTQAGGLFKRDLERLRGHPILSGPVADGAAELPDPALLTIEIGLGLGVIEALGDEWHAGRLPESWSDDLLAPVASVWAGLNGDSTWDPERGYQPDPTARPWRRSIGLAIVAGLLQAPPGEWFDPADLAVWLGDRQPDAARSCQDLVAWCRGWLLGVLHPLRIIESARSGDRWLVRLTALGRVVLRAAPGFPPGHVIDQTLLVQPNLEVLVYRQGLTPGLIGRLTRFADWRTLGLAGTLVLTPESVYRGLESGLTLMDLQQTLERHSSRPLSENVLATLRSWASKRERVQVFPAAVLLEFRSADDLESALRQGAIEQRLTDRIGLVSTESAVDYSRFRLSGSRDYQAAEEVCVEVAADGLTLTVAEGKADLLLVPEIQRFADVLDAPGDRSVFRASVPSLTRARENGVDARWLDDWFRRRTGGGIPPTLKLLFLRNPGGPVILNPTVVLRVPTAEFADGLERWPATRGLIVERLGPTSFAVEAARVEELRSLLSGAGIPMS